MQDTSTVVVDVRYTTNKPVPYDIADDNKNIEQSTIHPSVNNYPEIEIDTTINPKVNNEQNNTKLINVICDDSQNTRLNKSVGFDFVVTNSGGVNIITINREVAFLIILALSSTVLLILVITLAVMGYKCKLYKQQLRLLQVVIQRSSNLRDIIETHV
jgi:hypothetical protein